MKISTTRKFALNARIAFEECECPEDDELYPVSKPSPRFHDPIDEDTLPF